MKPTIVIAAFASLFLSGCARYRIEPVKPESIANWETGKDGYLIYQPELYFAATITTEVSKDSAGKDQTKQNVSVAPIFLPNYNRPYRITTFNFLAKADFSFDLENGWKLTKISDKSDNTTLANAVLGQLETMLKAGGLVTLKQGAPPPRKRLILYHPDYDDKGIIRGFTPVLTTELDGE